MIRPIHIHSDYQDLNISTRLLVDHALRKRYRVTYCPASADGETGIMICRKRSIEIRFKSDATSLSPIHSYFAAEDKVLTASLLEEAGVSMPVSFECSKYSEIAEKLDFEQNSYVVKPTSMNHGDGIRTNLCSPTGITDAISYALQVSGSSTVLVQEQVQGEEYRFLVLGDEVIAVAGRRPAKVTGDGVSTVRQLIENKNAEPGRGEGHLASRTKIDIDTVAMQFGNSLLDYIPATDEEVVVTQTSNLSKGGEAIDYTDDTHKSLKDMAIAAARACSLGLAGVDIMTDSITEPSRGFVIEVNLAPGLRMHHYPTVGQSRDVAGLIFDALEKEAQKAQTRIAVSTFVDFRSFKNMKQIPARIDTGARTSALWVSDLKVKGDTVRFSFFGPGSPYYTGKKVELPIAGSRVVTSSMGDQQERCMVELPIIIAGKKLRAKFTLADRSKQSYPILIGRNTLRGVFVVDSNDPGPIAIYKDPNEVKEYKETELIS